MYRLDLTFDEIMDVLDIKYTSETSIGCNLPPGIYEIIEIKLMVKFLLSDNVNVDIIIDDIRLKSNLTTFKTIRITKTSFFDTIIGFTQSNSRVLGDIER